MYDATKVVLKAIGKILEKDANTFRSNFRRGEMYNNGIRGIDCRKKSIVPWEHGENILKHIKQVSTHLFASFSFITQVIIVVILCVSPSFCVG